MKTSITKILALTLVVTLGATATLTSRPAHVEAASNNAWAAASPSATATPKPSPGPFCETSTRPQCCAKKDKSEEKKVCGGASQLRCSQLSSDCSWVN